MVNGELRKLADEVKKDADHFASVATKVIGLSAHVENESAEAEQITVPYQDFNDLLDDLLILFRDQEKFNKHVILTLEKE